MSLICIFAYVCVFLRRPTSWDTQPTAVVAEPTQFTSRADLFHLFTTVWPEVTWSIARTLHFHVRLCWVKIDSAVSLGETPNSEIAQCVLWGIIWRLAVRNADHIQFKYWLLRWLTSGQHRPFAARPTTPPVCLVAVVYYAVATTRLLLCACWLSLGYVFLVIFSVA